LASQSQLVPLYEHQEGSAFHGMHQEGQFAAERLAAAVSELRDMVVDAWHSSSEATVGYPRPSAGCRNGQSDANRRIERARLNSAAAHLEDPQ
jgi:hypothetical protein